MVSIISSGCADFESPNSIAFQQVPIDDSVENDSSIPEDENPVDTTPVNENRPELEAEENPTLTMNLRDKILSTTDISVIALDNAFEFYDINYQLIKNKKIITIFDITKHSGQRRLYVINTETGNVKRMHVAHGQNSDKNNDGIATEFSNTNGSLQSSLGFMLTAETYMSAKNGYSMRLDGLEARNSRVRERLIVVHGADYVKENLSKMGRSFGCPAVTMQNIQPLIDEIKHGSLFYIYHASHDS